MSEPNYAGTMPVAERQRFDVAALEAWMRANVEGFEGPIEVEQFRGGQSNPTFRISTARRRYVMRRKPFGKLLPSAHAVDREFRVMLVSMLVASLEATAGSVIRNTERILPSISGRSHCRLCSLVP